MFLSGTSHQWFIFIMKDHKGYFCSAKFIRILIKSIYWYLATPPWVNVLEINQTICKTLLLSVYCHLSVPDVVRVESHWVCQLVLRPAVHCPTLNVRNVSPYSAFVATLPAWRPMFTVHLVPTLISWGLSGPLQCSDNAGALSCRECVETSFFETSPVSL